MKITTTRSFLWVVNVAILAGVGLVAVELRRFSNERNTKLTSWFQRFMDQVMKPVKSRREGGQRASGQNFASIRDLNFTGALPRVESAPTASAPASQPTPAELPSLSGRIEIIGIIYDPGSPESAVCFLRPKGAASARGEGFHEGEAVFDTQAVVRRILPDAVIFARADRDETLPLPKLPVTPKRTGEGGGPTPGGAGGAPAVPLESVNWLQVFKPGSKSAHQIEIELTDFGKGVIDTHGEAILDGVTYDSETVEFRDGQKRNGIRLSSIPAGSALRAVGLEPGDVIVRVNERYVQNRAEIVQYIRSQPRIRPTYNVTVIRRGREMNVLFRTPQQYVGQKPR